MIVVDSSAVLDALIARPVKPRLLDRLALDADLQAPHLIDVEVVHALRRLVRTGDITEERAEEAREDFADLTIARYPHTPLVERMWQLRHSLTAYDAAFVALAEALDVPLVTSDARLSRAAGPVARVELVG